MSARDRSDRLNPVLLKEIRQGLRSKLFAILFPSCMTAATFLGIAFLVDSAGRENLGREVFMPVFCTLQVAVLGLVPFSAFQSMTGEWDEGTHDLLILSDLSPTRILFGKLLTAAIEAALYVSAFLPLLLFTFLLRGVDVRDIVFLVALLYLGSLAMSALAFALGGLTRIKLWRVLLLAALAGVGVLGFAGGYEFAEQFVERGRGIGTVLQLEEVLGMFGFVLGTLLLAFAFATTRIAHLEDDRSRAPRIAFTVVLAGALAIFGWNFSTPPSRSALDGFSVAFTVLAAVPALFFATEPEALPRHARQRVPRSPVLALLATPFQGGSGRGLALFLVHVALIGLFRWLVGVRASPAPAFPGASWVDSDTTSWAAFVAFTFVYLAVPVLLLRRVCQRPVGRLVARIVVPIAIVLSIFLPSLIGFVLEIEDWEDVEHPFNPFWVSLGPAGTEARLAVASCFVLVLVLSAPRIVRGFTEVQAASRARRHPGSERPATAEPAHGT